MSRTAPSKKPTMPPPGADLVNWGPQANIVMGPYTFAHIHLDQP